MDIDALDERLCSLSMGVACKKSHAVKMRPQYDYYDEWIGFWGTSTVNFGVYFQNK